MPHTLTEMDNGSCKNMVSNLPLLFAGGYPTSLEKITETQLEKFIPFMVQCSLGYIHIPALEEYSEPEWWPADLEFVIPFCRPKSFRGNWLEKMRELVVICYSFHKCVFLLRFCTDLASYEPATLRFINNYNSTTSLYQRHSKKLLVTFRNENMLYDQPPQTSGRKCLLPKQINSVQSDLQQEQMVEPAFFDIYLCDDCDAELYSFDAYVEHEKICINQKAIQEESEDDDVIFCGSEVLPTPMQQNEQKSHTTEQTMSSFLMNFNLWNGTSHIARRTTSTGINPNNNILDGSPEKLRRLPRRTRGVITLSKCTSIPLSSPCGQFLLKSTKTVMSIDYQMERLERLERFCFAPALLKQGTTITNRPKWMNRSRLNTNVSVSYKRGFDENEPYHCYKVPRRQFSTACKKRNFNFYNKLLINGCKPCAVKLQRLTAEEIENRNIDIRLQKLNVARTFALSHQQSDVQDKLKHIVVDCIDLCSSDEDDLCMKNSGNSSSSIIAIDRVAITADSLKPKCQNKLSDPGNIIEMNPCIPFLNKFGKCSSNPLVSSMNLIPSLQATSPDTFASNVEPICSNMLLQNSICATETSTDSNIVLSNVENLTEVIENRVNDWLNNSAAQTENVALTSPPHLVITSATSLANSSTSNITNNNASKSMPSLTKLAKSSSAVNSENLLPLI
ncbi:uncharacterized protein LOC5570798 isoform X2 [Aedes aegypti]|uniref:Nuclear respiratory factor 1 NLS/DNA-binding dimerisation domain-containing protein n=1 Tax=Aedes aegypti TaxID=7159 RepID=A0A6I8TTU2_AEDAE|nr:uncharacterized protein LOC5570798 isoform X2 [Aedes aegypti]